MNINSIVSIHLPNSYIFARSSKEIVRDMKRVKSSNIYSYTMELSNKNPKVGNVYVQFHTDGKPNDIYVYYDVPVNVYRRWHTASSKGSYFWAYIRNIYKYSKLTGDKLGKLRNAINHYQPLNYDQQKKPQGGGSDEENN